MPRARCRRPSTAWPWQRWPGRARGGTRLADADFNGALVRSLDEVLDGKPGIVWVLTNNKNSRNNSPEIDRNTRDFAELIRSSPFLPFVAAYPVRMPVTGRLFTERGLIIYAIAYGDAAGAALSRIVDSAADARPCSPTRRCG